MAISLFLVAVRCCSHLLTLSATSPSSKTPGIVVIYHTIRYISASGLYGHIVTSGYPSMSHLSVDTFFELGVIENFIYRARISVILTYFRLFGCVGVCDYDCAQEDELLLLPVLSVIVKMNNVSCLVRLVILPFSVSNIQKFNISEVYIFAS